MLMGLPRGLGESSREAIYDAWWNFIDSIRARDGVRMNWRILVRILIANGIEPISFIDMNGSWLGNLR